MMQKLLKKTVPLPQRPKLPDENEIIADVQRSEDDDVVFNIPKGEGNDVDSGLSMLSGDSYSFEDNAMPPNRSSTPDSEHSHNVDEVYKKAVTFLEITDTLKLAPDTLKGQVEELKKMGSELTESIDELKRQSETALKKS